MTLEVADPAMIQAIERARQHSDAVKACIVQEMGNALAADASLRLRDIDKKCEDGRGR